MPAPPAARTRRAEGRFESNKDNGPTKTKGEKTVRLEEERLRASEH